MSKRGRPSTRPGDHMELAAGIMGGPAAAADVHGWLLADSIRTTIDNPEARFEEPAWSGLRAGLARLFEKIEVAVTTGDRGPLDRFTAACLAYYNFKSTGRFADPLRRYLFASQTLGTWKDVQKALKASSGVTYDRRTIERNAKAIGMQLTRIPRGGIKGRRQAHKHVVRSSGLKSPI